MLAAPSTIGAQKLLDRYPGWTPRLILTEALRRENVRVTAWPFADEISGMLWYYKERPVIALNKGHSRRRRLFTAAHEYAHHLLGHGGGFFCGEFLRTRDPRELEANEFAAELLMPEARVTRLAEKGLSAARIALALGVSREAMEWRLKLLGLADRLPPPRQARWGL